MSKERLVFVGNELLSSIGAGISIVGWIWFGIAMYLRCIDATIYATNDSGLIAVIEKARHDCEVPKANGGKAVFMLVINPKGDKNETKETADAN